MAFLRQPHGTRDAALAQFVDWVMDSGELTAVRGGVRDVQAVRGGEYAPRYLKYTRRCATLFDMRNAGSARYITRRNALRTLH